MRQRLATSLDCVHRADLNQASLTVPPHGVNLSKNQFILLYDSTPYATKGHIALNMPCDVTSPNVPEFEVLVGRAPDLATLPVGYIPQISSPLDMYGFHGFLSNSLIPSLSLVGTFGSSNNCGKNCVLYLLYVSPSELLVNFLPNVR